MVLDAGTEKRRGERESWDGKDRRLCFQPCVSSSADDSRPAAGHFKGSFVSSLLEMVSRFHCEPSSQFDTHLSRLETLLPELLF